MSVILGISVCPRAVKAMPVRIVEKVAAIPGARSNETHSGLRQTIAAGARHISPEEHQFDS